eukprot:CAMPEP_0173458326 /NCGR_PEP_ID=MMETSP1357-20121228/59403_1 /TAXON_ID=77926 /ORGANISM="Hemiselmis rufescens, Strain PCC563" /LENGTH=48 /DNA_ID= /DNA_START= /DNA_END= /DNA_ORIENTATION=
MSRQIGRGVQPPIVRASPRDPHGGTPKSDGQPSNPSGSAPARATATAP